MVVRKLEVRRFPKRTLGHLPGQLVNINELHVESFLCLNYSNYYNFLSLYKNSILKIFIFLRKTKRLEIFLHLW